MFSVLSYISTPGQGQQLLAGLLKTIVRRSTSSKGVKRKVPTLAKKKKSLKTQVQQDKKKVRAGKSLKGSRAHRSNSEAEPQTKYTLGVPLRIKNKSEEEAILPPLWSRGVFIIGFPADQTKPTQYPGGVRRALQIKSKYVCSNLDLALSLELRC